MKRILLILAVILIIPYLCFGATYYVDQVNGNDSSADPATGGGGLGLDTGLGLR